MPVGETDGNRKKHDISHVMKQEPVPEFLVCSLLAILVIALTLGVVRVIQESSCLNFLMFGKESNYIHKLGKEE